MTDAILTTARNSLWDAIDNWAPFAGVFKRKYKFDGDDSPEINPTEEQLPAIMIYPDPGFARMVKNRAYEHTYKLSILIFTSTWNLVTADRYAEDIVNAAWQSDGGVGTPYVKLATGFYPENEITIDHDRIRIDSKKATLTSIGIALRVRFDPQN